MSLSLKYLGTFLFLFTSFWSSAQYYADFTSDTTSGCAPVTIKFQNKSSSSNVRFLWSLGNGNVSSLENPQAIYYLPGTYTVSLTITDSTGKKAIKTDSAYITVYANPSANFSGSNLRGCAPLEVPYKDKSKKGSGRINAWTWDFGDGNTSRDSQPEHKYKSAGTYNVSLLVRDIYNCESKEIKKKYVEVLPSADVNFEADLPFGCTPPHTVQFTNKSTKTSSGATYKWYFGDGDSSTQEHPQHIYKSKGKFDVTLVVTNGNGCVSKHTMNNYIVISTLTPDFKADKTYACAPAKITFSNLTSPQASNLSYKWNFGNGQEQFGETGVANYASPGTYSVTLTVYAGSCTESVTKSQYIKIDASPIPNFSLSDSLACKVPLTVTMQNQSTGYSSIEWLYNGKSKGTSEYNYMTFDAYGDHKITLIAKTFGGCQVSKSKTVSIKELEPHIIAKNKTGCIPKRAYFTDATDTWDSITKRTWVFGDGTTIESNTDTISHVYQDSGKFKVKLILETASGCSGTASDGVEYGIKLNPFFEAPVDTFCNKMDLDLKNKTVLLDSVAVDSIQWHHIQSDSSINSNKIGEKFFEGQDAVFSTNHDSGWYSISLVMEHKGCWDTFTVDSQIYIDPPNAKFNIDEVDFCNQQELSLEDVTHGGDTSYWIIYDPKTGETTYSTEKELHFDIEDEGKEITLYSNNEHSGCVDWESFKVDFPGQRTIAEIQYEGDLCAPSSLVFVGTFYDTIEYTWFTPTDTLYGRQHLLSFDQPGDYQVILEVYNPFNFCRHRDTADITINGPEVSGKISGQEGCSPAELTLTSNSDPKDFNELYWLIEDERIDIESTGDIKHTLIKPGPDTDGSYLISLIGIDSQGCRASQEFHFRVDGVLNSRIKTRRFKSCDSDEYIFEIEAPDYDLNKLEWEWDFDDGTSSDQAVVNKTLSENRKYEISLTITEANGCVTVLDETIDINKEKLYVDFNADSLETDCPPLFVQFRSESTAKNRSIKSFYWEFGDGSTSTEENPSKLYLQAGRFTVKLFVEDEWGCTDSMIYPDFVLVNGPEGSYNFDKKLGCVPLEVNFECDTSGTHHWEWDMGDGNVIEDKLKVKHIYDEPGRYIPLLILSDTFGCSYTVPPIDTIYVDPHPEPQIFHDGICQNELINFTSYTENVASGIAKYEWAFHNLIKTDSSNLATPSYQYTTGVLPRVDLRVTTKTGCVGSTRDTLNLNLIVADFDADQDGRCVGTPLDLRYTGQNQSKIISFEWNIADQTYNQKNFSIIPDKVGPMLIDLLIVDELGCRDSLSSLKIIVGDSVAPPPAKINVVSVVDDESIEINFNPTGNADFYSYEIYRDGSNESIHSETNKFSTYYLDQGIETRRVPHCYVIETTNTCGLSSRSTQSDVHCNVECGASGEVNRNVIRWSPYIGWDSMGTVSYQIMREIEGSPDEYSPISSWLTGQFNFYDSTVNCNTHHRYKIIAQNMNSYGLYSSSDTCAAKPLWENHLKPNELIRASVVDDKEITIEWDSVPRPQMPITEYILEKSKDGENFYVLGKYGQDNNWELLDAEVEVDDRSYFYRMYAVDQCGDTSPYSNIGKTILLKADTTIEQRPILNWSTYIGWAAGVEYYTIEIENEDGSFSEIGSSEYMDTSFIDWVTMLNQRPEYCYRIIGHQNTVPGKSRVVSISNVDCSPVRSYIWIPNAFSPNGDNINDKFVTPGLYIVDYHCMIYNRWGELVFESFDYYHRWDGTYKGEPCQMDAYMVIVESTGVDRVKQVHHGTVTLVR
ncbi:PKD domain-containing protein [bacterium]|nr:PKD domain-containing protein [bacterium]